MESGEVTIESWKFLQSAMIHFIPYLRANAREKVTSTCPCRQCKRLQLCWSPPPLQIS